MEDGGLHLTVSETGWAKSVWGKLYGQWLGGSCIFVYDFDKFNAAETAGHDREISTSPPICCSANHLPVTCIQEDFSKYDLSSLKHCSVAGEPLNPDSGRASGRSAPACELTGGLWPDRDAVVILATFPWMQGRSPGSMGKPAPVFDVDLIDEEGNSCPPGVSGEIVIRTHHGAPIGMFSGYYHNQDMTDDVWDGNDLPHQATSPGGMSEGYCWYVGRADDVIKSSGYRIGPFEVESALLEHPAVLETAITGVPDPLRGQVVKATIVLKPGYEPSDALKKELQDHVKHLTAPYKYPRVVEFVDSLPKTISGKIRRTELRARDAAK